MTTKPTADIAGLLANNAGLLNHLKHRTELDDATLLLVLSAMDETGLYKASQKCADQNIPDTLPEEQRTSQPETTGSPETDQSGRVNLANRVSGADAELLKSIDSMMEDLHNAITIEPTGLFLTMGQCIDRYDQLKAIRAALTSKPDAAVDVEEIKRQTILGVAKYSLMTNENAYYIKKAIDHLYSSGRLSSKAEWQDISTAPRDGTTVLLWVKTNNLSTGHLRTGFWFTAAENPHWSCGGWMEEPTHWQPLPQPPKSKTEE